SGYEAVVGETPVGRQLLGIKYTPHKAPAVWRTRVGRYRFTPREGDYHFFQGFDLDASSEGHLLIRPYVDGPGDPPPWVGVHPVDDSWAVTVGVGRNRSVWIRFDETGRLHYLGLVMTKSEVESECTGQVRCEGRFKKRRSLPR